MKFRFLVLLIFVYWIHCDFFKKNLPISAPGIGVEMENSKFVIYFEVGILTTSDLNLSKSSVQEIIDTTIKDIEKDYDFIKLKPIVDQPLDAIFIIQKSTKKKKNPFVQVKKIQLDSEWERINPILFFNKKENQLYFSFAELENYIYNQVRYDVIFLPLPILNDLNIEEDQKILENTFFISKGRNSLDKISYVVLFDNSDLPKSSLLVKKTFLSLIFYIHPNWVGELTKNQEYLELRKEILQMYYNYHKGKQKSRCQDIENLEKKIFENISFHKNPEYFIYPLKENFQFFKKKCK
ncbi:MAG: hypothetical protein ACK4UJ_00185 [Leptonema sp. (in: bacteria)]